MARLWFLVACSSIALLTTTSGLCLAAERPVRVFLLAGQSNMEGQSVADLAGKNYNEGRGTLARMFEDPAQAKCLAYLKTASGDWATRDDVTVSYQPSDGPLKYGPLGLGFGAYPGGHHFGPELQFGHVVGDALEDPVLLIKTAWGGKSLAVDFRPPGAGGDVGPCYEKMIAQARVAIDRLEHPTDGSPPRKAILSGFVWYHGWNDGCDPQHAVPEYRENLIHLIDAVRKDLHAPDLPVVVGELTGPWVEAPGEWNTLRQAQKAATELDRFRGTVRFAPTHDFVRAPEDSPNPGHGHHEFGNAETGLLVGNALGEAMVKLLPKPGQ
jgi:Carbohydrate esterase, sialic acid-specific acetylesterase